MKTDIKPLHCAYCEWIFFTWGAIEKHIRENHGPLDRYRTSTLT